MHRKLASAKQARANYVCMACTYCQIQFEQKQPSDAVIRIDDSRIPSILISQPVGLSVGPASDEIGMVEENRKKLLEPTGEPVRYP